MDKISGCTMRFSRVANRLVKSEGVGREHIWEFLRSGENSATSDALRNKSVTSDTLFGLELIFAA